MFEKVRPGVYAIDGREYALDSLLPAITACDEEAGGRYILPPEECASLKELLLEYNGYPDFSSVTFMKYSSELFSYIASSKDSELLALVASNMGWKSDAEKEAEIKNYYSASRSYQLWWRSYAEDLLTTEGYDDYHFGPVKQDSQGCYLYDDERAVLYVEVSRDGEEKRNCVLSMTLLGNPEAITNEQQNMEFEWCCYFDDLLTEEGDDAVLLGGSLRTIDPFGEKSKLLRRYDLRYKDLLPNELATITRELIRVLGMYPPQA